MSIRQNFPTTPPSLVLDFANSKTLDPRITFSRTTTATRMNELGLIETVSADVARFDHKYENGVIKSLGLLVEESRVNYEKYTEDPTQWTIANMIPTGNSITLPTGVGSTAIEYRGETTDPNSKLIRPLPTNAGVVAGETWCFSIFLKAGTEDTVNINFTNNTATEGVRVNSFNMLTGEDSGIVEIGGTTNGEFNAVSYPNGWWRISIRGTYSLNASGQQTLIRLKGYSNQVTETTSFSAWGAQLEKAPFPTSYIPNGTDSQATRNPDTVTMTGDNFSDWYNSSEWTLMIAARRNYSGNFLTYPNLARINDGTINNNVGFYGALNSTQFTNYGVNSGGVNQTPYVAINVPTTSQFKMIQALKENDSTFGVNGTLTTTDTSVLMPVGVNQLLIGSDGATGRWGATIQQLTYYPVRLPNSTLQTLTK